MKKVYELFAAGAGLAARSILGVFSPSKMKKYVLGALAAASTATLAVALMAGDLFPGAGDLKITYKGEVNALIIKEKLEGIRYYSSKFQCFRDNNTIKKEDTITDYKNSIKYTINHKGKVVYKETLDDIVKCMKLHAAYLQQYNANTQRKPSAKTEKSGKIEYKTEKLGKATIARRTCDKWKITVMGSASFVYVDPSLENPISKSSLVKWSQEPVDAIFGKGTGEGFAKLSSDSKIKGFPLKTEAEIFGMSSKEEVTKVETAPIPASVFELPKGYKVEDKGKKDVEEAEKNLKELQNNLKGSQRPATKK